MAERSLVAEIVFKDKASKAAAKVDSKFDKANDTLAATDKKMSKLTKTEKALTAQSEKLGKTFGAMAGAAGAGAALFALTRLGGAALDAALDFEQTKVSFETMLGSAAEATKLLKDLEEFSLVTPFTPDEIINTSKKLLGFGVVAEDQIGVISRLGDVAAGMNIPLGDLAQIFGKTFTKGKVQAEELNQMAERGIPIIKVLSQVMGEAEEDIFKLASEGAIGFKEVDEAFTLMTTSGGTFNEMMAKQSKTGRGLLSTLQGFKEVLLRKFGEQILEIAKPLLETLVRWAGALAKLAENTKLMKVAFGVFVTVFVGFAGILVASLVSLATAAAAASVAFWPIIGIFFAVGAAVAALVIWWKPISKFFKTIFDWGKKSGLFEPFILLFKLIKNLFRIINENRDKLRVAMLPFTIGIELLKLAFEKLAENKDKVLGFFAGMIAFYKKHKAIFDILFLPFTGAMKGLRALVDITSVDGARAAGGPVGAGGSFLVGEKGPEIFTPEMSGFVAPVTRTGGRGATITISPTIIVRQATDAVEKVERMVKDSLDKLAPQLEAELGLS